MDFNKDEELDYEEDGLENDFVKNYFESKNDAEYEIDENSNISGSNDGYIEINCSEEEKNFLERIAVESESAKMQNDKKADEESGKAELKKPPLGKKQCTQPNNSNENSHNSNSDNNNNSTSNSIGSNSSSFCNGNSSNNINSETKNEKLIKKKRPFQRRLEKRKPPANLTLNSWLPKLNFSNAYNVMKPPRQFAYDKQVLNLYQDFYSNSGFQFPMVGLTAAQLEQNLSRLMPTSDRRLRHENLKPTAFIRCENFKNTGNFSTKGGGTADNYKIWKTKKNSKHCTLHVQNDNSPDTKNKNYDEKNKNSFFNKLCTSMKDDEKELVKLKKEARLKRFMNDDIVRKERKLINSSENEIKDGLNLGAEYFQKLEEQKLRREELLSLKGQQRKNLNFNTDINASTEKPDIKKELLLKKRNPFDADLGKSECSLTSTIKQEKKRHEEIKQENFDMELFIPPNEQFRKNEERKLSTSSDSSPWHVNVVKSETGFPVKFFRTISKNFNELALRKPKIKVLEKKEDESSSPNTVMTLPFAAANKISYSRTGLSSQAESQLTGCIVKVFNIPPSTTTDDILALCSPVGIVKEIKLNLPKENSAVIRFGEPAWAESFFSVYHGQKMNNYFLNVIVI